MADAVEGRVDKRKKGDRGGLLWGQGDFLRCTESPSDLPVAVSIPPESVLETSVCFNKTTRL
jgi:hypothetical protein